MSYRLVGRAAEKIDEILLDSARRWGIDAAARYHRLILTALTTVGKCPTRLGSRAVPRITGLRTYHLHSARRLVPREHRVAEPRHVVIYRVAPDGAVEILSLVHDRMLLARAARRASDEADA